MVEDELASIRKILLEHERRIAQLERLSEGGQIHLRKGLSIREFILQKQAKTDIDRTLVVGYYLESNREVSPFNVDDLEKGFREAKEVVPKNIHLAVIGCVSKGYIMEAEEKKSGKKAWTLTNSGIGYVDNGLVVPKQ
ncbi:MAG TPA: hypothetical protein VMS77_06185 [Conexivisphaerales archaeon]|nr:hypothetical protein [Conexivisphaerales archaeon]